MSSRPVTLLVLRLGLAYTLLYSLRNLITTASAYLFDVGDLSRRTFAIMQTTSFFFIFLCKFASGPLLRYVRGFNRLVAFFICIQLGTCICFSALGIIGITRASGTLLACFFVLVYCVVKLSASFTRVTVLELIYRSPDHQIQTFGVITTTLQILACIGDAGGKYALGMFLNMTSLKEYADRRNVPRWCVPMLIISSTAVIGILSSATLFRRGRVISRSTTFKSKTAQGVAQPREILRQLAGNPRFLICCGNSLITSAISVAMGTYGSHFMRYKIGIASENVPLYDSLSPFFILFGIGIGGFLINRFSHWRSRVLCFMMFPSLIATGVLVYLTFGHDISFIGMLALYYIHQTCFYAFQNSLDGAYLMCVVEPGLAPSATGIVSGIGYVGGLAVPFTILKYSTSSEGWTLILQCVFALEMLMLLPMVVLMILDMRRRTDGQT